jgi:hypothetical protein
MLSLATRSYLAYRQEVDYRGFNELNIYREYCHIYIVAIRIVNLPPIQKVGCIYELSEPKHHAYTTNNTLSSAG